jgi:sortase A
VLIWRPTRATPGGRVSGNDRSWRRLVELVLVIIGVICLGYYGFQTLEARNFQRQQIADLEELLAAPAPNRVDASSGTEAPAALTAPEAAPPIAPTPRKSSDSRQEAPAGDAAVASRSALALLEIPRLNLSSAILPGDSADVLGVAIGHLPDTPRPWERGNSALAAHRDGLFRPLRNIRLGDEIRVRSEQGDQIYRVSETKVVMPDDLSVLQPTATPTLTLITCYPFNFIGSAPKRFIVHAERVDVPPTSP